MDRGIVITTLIMGDPSAVGDSVTKAVAAAKSAAFSSGLVTKRARGLVMKRPSADDAEMNMRPSVVIVRVNPGDRSVPNETCASVM
jgi:hypothetical protein